MLKNKMDIKELLGITYSRKASDLHIMSGAPPILRINGELISVLGTPPLSTQEAYDLVLSLVNEEQKEILLVNKELDFSFPYEEHARFRVNAYFQKGTLAASLRLLSAKIPTIEEINLPEICHNFAKLKQGFILISGPTGHGKSTTLAAIIEEINQTRPVHVITIEDPIEYVFTRQKAVVSQREVRADTHSWQIALRSCLREDPDVVMIGEMRDYETIAAALTIAETGHLVFSTLHTNSAAQTLDRIVDVFPENQQAQVKMQLSSTLEAVLQERLLPSLEGGRIPAFEILLATAAVKNSIREGQTHLIDNVIQTSVDIGMQTLEMDLARLVKKGKVSLEAARAYSIRPMELIRLTRSK